MNHSKNPQLYSTHDAQNVYVNCEDRDLACNTTKSRVKGELKMSIVNTRHIDGSRWLMILWVKSEGVYVNSFSWSVGVMLIWLDKSEVTSITLGEAVMSVQLKLGCSSWVITIIISVLSGEVAVVQVFVVGAVNVIVTSDNPYDFLDGVVKVKLNLVGKSTEGFLTLELKLFNQILVLSLSETATLIGIKEDIVNVQTCVTKSYR